MGHLRGLKKQGAACAAALLIVGCAPQVPRQIPEAGVSAPATSHSGVPAADPLMTVPNPAVTPRVPARPRPPVYQQPPAYVPPSVQHSPYAYQRPKVQPKPRPPVAVNPPEWTESVNPAPVLSGGSYASHPGVQAFIQRMQQVNGFDGGVLQQLFAQIQRNDDIIGKATTPAEGKSWAQYRPIFLTADRINSGVNFWQQHSQTLDAAAARYGVDPAYIVAIIGVETLYGRNVGKYPVLQALTTLAFDFPRRADFYQKELEQYLLLTRDNGFEPLSLVGSYAGAMGLGQFISSSYREYAEDFNGDGRRDLWDADDAIASVANYLAKHGWQQGEGVAVPAYVSGTGYARLLAAKPVKPSQGLGALAALGVSPAAPLQVRQAGIIELDAAEGSEIWVTGTNFYVITRYNHSNKYAMAVHQLAQAIAQRVGR